MRNIVKNLIIAFLIFILISALFAAIKSPFKKIEEIPLSNLISEINNEKVKEITVQGNKLDIILNDETKKTAVKETEAGLSETLKNYGVQNEKLEKIKINVKEEGNAGFLFGTILPFLLPVILIGLIIWFMMRQVQKGSMQAFTFSRSKARVIMPNDKREKTTFKDVAGNKEAKEELQEIVEFLKSPKKFIQIGARIPKGVLLMGSPGTGKTLMAKAVAGEANVPFFHISGSEFVELFVGVGAGRVRDLFQMAKKQSPTIVFIDEIDAVGRQRGTGLGGGHDEREQTLNQILVEMDGFETDEAVIVIAATNRPDVLDPALLRPGRFDRRVILDEPDIKDREEILKIHARNKPFAPNVNLRTIAERTPGFSGADLANLINEGAILAARRSKKIITQEELIESIEKVMLGPERKSHILTVAEKKIAAYHEAGHALTAASLPEADPVHKVSIISRGRAAGYTLKLPIEDRHLHSKTYFLTELAIALGGYVAEKQIFKDITTGASNDLQKASELARALVTQYGMSEKIGPVAFAGHGDLVFLGRELGMERHYSEEISAIIDQEVSRFIKEAQKKTEKILKEKEKLLEKIAKILIEKETIEREEFEKLVK
ncbi:MAG: ATP-dependent zinc metalloprotease FtsH [Parcubacteria group bacterium]|nr:ATP-dependent zinc metalloprotease FtsH [Parcubacteria group bacterium]